MRSSPGRCASLLRVDGLLNISRSRREHIEVLPYATPLNGVHASYIPRLREWAPAYVPGWVPTHRAFDNGKRYES
jgi:hypothetical protein